MRWIFFGVGIVAFIFLCSTLFSGANQQFAQNAQNNLQNSQAAENYAQATAVIQNSNGQEAFLYAQSTAVVANSYQGPINTYKDGQSSMNPLVLIVGGIAAFCVAFVALKSGGNA